MIVHISKSDQEHVEKVCGILDHYCRFFTNENNPLLLQVEVEWSKGVDLTAAQAFHFGRMVETYHFEKMMKRIL